MTNESILVNIVRNFSRHWSRHWLVALLLLGVTFCGNSVQAQIQFPDIDKLSQESKVDLVADNWTMDDNTKVIRAEGNVKMVYESRTLYCDVMDFDTITEVAVAVGNVRYINEKGDFSQTLPELRVNMGTGEIEGDPRAANTNPGEWVPSEFRFYQYPVWVIAEGASFDGEDTVRGTNVVLTTCDPETEPNFYARAKSGIYYKDQNVVVLRNVTWYWEGLKVLHLRKYTVDLNRRPTNYDVIPGYDSRDGFFILNAYTVYFGLNSHSRTHLDFRSERGVGIGQTFAWYDRADLREEQIKEEQKLLPAWEREPEAVAQSRQYDGSVSGYYINDQAPYRDAEQEARQGRNGIDIPDNRYRLRLSHYQQVSSNNTLFVEGNYWSDYEITRDFFEEEYRIMPVPENRVTAVHYDRDYTITLEANKQLNDDLFGSVNQVPEATLGVYQLPVFNSGIYYDSFNSAGLFERTYSDIEEAAGFQEYDTSRLHTSHRLLYPTKHFGFLNLIPRVGYYGTMYGDTFEFEDQPDVTTSVDSNGVTTATTNSITGIRNLSGDTRNLVEAGFGTSFKAFKVLHNDRYGRFRKGLRHVAEPYVDYTFIPEPDLRAANIYQFDFIDTFDRRNDVVIGMRNKLQTKEAAPGVRNLDGTALYNIIDMFDVNVGAVYLFDPEPVDSVEQESLSSLFLDAEARITPWLQVDMRGTYDNQEQEIERINTQVQLRAPDYSFIALDHVYRPEQYNLIQSFYGLLPLQRFSLYGYSRFEIDEGELEEQSFMVTMKNDCIGYGLGGTWRLGDALTDKVNEEDEWKVFLQVWLQAFPTSPAVAGSTYKN